MLRCFVVIFFPFGTDYVNSKVLPIKWPALDYAANFLEIHSNNVWVLQVLLRSLSHSELKFFLQYFIPIADRLFEKASESKKEGIHTITFVSCSLISGLSVEAAVLNNTACRIWDLFPKFCSHPIDIQESFPCMAASTRLSLLLIT
jgi:hypothetical protein